MVNDKWLIVNGWGLGIACFEGRSDDCRVRSDRAVKQVIVIHLFMYSFARYSFVRPPKQNK